MPGQDFFKLEFKFCEMGPMASLVKALVDADEALA
jgi:hypothetical protein